jgi:hypothetical protein
MRLEGFFLAWAFRKAGANNNATEAAQGQMRVCLRVRGWMMVMFFEIGERGVPLHPP